MYYQIELNTATRHHQGSSAHVLVPASCEGYEAHSTTMQAILVLRGFRGHC